MSDSNRPDSGPAGDGVLSVEEGADAISDILGPDDLDPDEGAESKPEATEDADDADIEGDEPEMEADDADADEDVDDADEDGETEDDDSPDEPASIEDQMVTMADGRTITVGQLRDYADNRVRDMQRAFTQKTTDLGERQKAMDAEAQTLSQQRDFLLRMMEAAMPAEPDTALADPNSPQFDLVRYNHENARYNQAMRDVQQLQQHMAWENQQQQQKHAEDYRQAVASELALLHERRPEFKDAAFRQQFQADVDTIGQEAYGITYQQVANIGTAVELQVLADAIAFRKLKKQTPKAKKAIEGKPKPLRGSKRSNPKSKASQGAKARADRLAKTGTMEAGVASLMDFDL